MSARFASAGPLHAAALKSPLVLLAVVGTLLGIFAALAKLATGAGWHPLALLFWSLLVSGAILLAIAVNSGQPPKRSRRTLTYNLGSGVLSAMLPNALTFAAIPHVGAGFVALCFAFPPLITYVIALALRMERFRALRVAGLALAFAGVIVMVAAKVSLGDAAPVWIAVALAAPLFVASGNIFRSFYWPRGATPLALAPGMLLAAALTLLPILAVSGVPLAPRLEPTTLTLLALQIAVFTGMYSLIFQLQSLAGAVYLSQIGSVGAIAGAVIAIVVLGEPASVSLAVAAAAILGGALLVNRTR
jgi:drug/metabolite transporter (DMT)-like permease